MRRGIDKKKLIQNMLWLAAVIALSFLFVTFVAQRTKVHQSSMWPTFNDGDQLIVEKISYRFHEPERYDVVVFPVEDNKNYIKRVAALPGETVQVKNGSLYINGKLFKEKLDKMDEAGIAEKPITLGEDEYFVLGDNRNNSTDSRRIGPVKRNKIKGKVWIRLYPKPGKVEMKEPDEKQNKKEPELVQEYPEDIDVDHLKEWKKDKEALSWDSVWFCPVCGGDTHVFGVEEPKNGRAQCSECGEWLRYPDFRQDLLYENNH